VTPTFKVWRDANPGEWQCLRAYVQQLAANQHPAKPKLMVLLGVRGSLGRLRIR
jgi:hypothetical protein